MIQNLAPNFVTKGDMKHCEKGVILYVCHWFYMNGNKCLLSKRNLDHMYTSVTEIKTSVLAVCGTSGTQT